MDLIDLSGTVGLIAMGVLTLNILIGLLQSIHYDTARSWPRRKINLFAIHNWTGYLGLAIAVLHPVLLLFAPESHFRIFDVLLPVRSPGEALENTVGAVALYGVVFVVVTSLLRHRLGRGLWKGFHYVSYVAALMMFAHGIFTDAPNVAAAPLDPIDAERLTTEGCLLAILIASGLRLRFGLGSRLDVVPASRVTIAPSSRRDDGPPSRGRAVVEPAALPVSGWAGRLRVGAVFVETPSVKTFRLVPEEGGPLPFTFLAGQFANVETEIRGARVTRSYTIVSSPSQREHLEIAVKHEANGLFSAHLHECVREGALLSIRAPFGRFTFTGTEADRIVLIGGGIGVTPLVSVLRYLTDICWGGEIVLVESHKTPEQIVFASELDLLERRLPRFQRLTTITGEGAGWGGRRGRLSSDVFREIVNRGPRTRFHICGPEPMTSAICTILEQLGAPKEAIAMESFGPSPKLPGLAVSASFPADADSSAPLVRFERSGRRAVFTPGRTLLAIAHAERVPLNDGCRIGVCGNCRVRLLAGCVDHGPETALASEERRAGFILACQARVASSDVIVDA